MWTTPRNIYIFLVRNTLKLSAKSQQLISKTRTLTTWSTDQAHYHCAGVDRVREDPEGAQTAFNSGNFRFFKKWKKSKKVTSVT